jgi:uncharacterized protein YkwD
MHRFGLALTLVLALLGGVPAGEQDKGKLTKEEQRLVDETNAARKKEGLEPLTVNLVLVETARKHSQAMAAKRKLDHVLDGVGPEERIKASGYKFLAWAENIQFSTRKGEEAADLAVQQWLKSQVHRDNMLGKEFTETGVGAATNSAGETYFTQVFGKPRP